MTNIAQIYNNISPRVSAETLHDARLSNDSELIARLSSLCQGLSGGVRKGCGVPTNLDRIRLRLLEQGRLSALMSRKLMAAKKAC